MKHFSMDLLNNKHLKNRRRVPDDKTRKVLKSGFRNIKLR